MRSRIPTC
jgi:drug/metabolite transporter (DMT)-like permease